MTTNWALRSLTTVTMATQQWAEIPLHVSWGMMGSRCGTGLCRHVKVGDTPKELHPHKHMHYDYGKLMWQNFKKKKTTGLHKHLLPFFNLTVLP